LPSLQPVLLAKTEDEISKPKIIDIINFFILIFYTKSFKKKSDFFLHFSA